jgi:hypothetical protein
MEMHGLKAVRAIEGVLENLARVGQRGRGACGDERHDGENAGGRNGK